LENNIIAEKSFAFAVRIVKLSQYIENNHKEYILSKQVLRSGKSIGANIEEAIGGYSRKDFAAKMSISYKETRETKYWLKLLRSTEYINENIFQSLYKDADEIGKVLYRVIKNTKSK